MFSTKQLMIMAGNHVIYLYEQARLLSIHTLGNTLVIAPHPDDETLGCGGTIALLRQGAYPVHVIFISDGSMSHPNSKKYSAEERVILREKEAIEALKMLGVDENNLSFMRLKDSEVPGVHQVGFDEAVAIFLQKLESVKPATILLPWRRDPHKDHRATWQIVQASLARYPHKIRMLEYFIWLWERAESEDLPTKEEAILWQTDIETVTKIKQDAIRAHTSQVTMLIDDDPEGFTLSPEVLMHFSGNNELFAEVLNQPLI